MTVVNVNDNNPTFLSSLYEVNVTEGLESQAAVLTVQAIDKDDEDRLLYTIHAVMDTQSRNKFTIESVSGWSNNYVI